MISDSLNKNLIINPLEANSRGEIFEKMGQLLIAQGYCKETFVDALKAREMDFPTGLDIEGFGVAIPHTDTSHIIKPAIGIAILKEPVLFSQMGTDDEFVNARIIFLLAVKDPSKHLPLLQELLCFIQDREFLKELVKSKTNQEVLEMIKSKEKVR